MSQETQQTPHERQLAELAALQNDYDRSEADFEQAKNEAKALKQIMEKKASKVFDFIRALNQPLPLFEVWKATPVSELGLPDGIVAILNENNLDTVGKLAEYANSGKDLTQVPHIGENKAEAIRQALERFWKDRHADDVEET